MGDERRTDDSGSGAVHGLAVHAVVFVSVNLLLLLVWAMFVPDAAFDQIPNLLAHPSQAKAANFFPLYVLAFWGVGLLIHAGVVIVGAPSRARRRRARRRQRRALQAGVVGVLGDTILADAAVAGITYVDGDKAAKQVRRDADKRRTRSTSRSWRNGSGATSRTNSSTRRAS